MNPFDVLAESDASDIESTPSCEELAVEPRKLWSSPTGVEQGRQVEDAYAALADAARLGFLRNLCGDRYAADCRENRVPSI